jgi:hypothetical protein
MSQGHTVQKPSAICACTHIYTHYHAQISLRDQTDGCSSNGLGLIFMKSRVQVSARQPATQSEVQMTVVYYVPTPRGVAIHGGTPLQATEGKTGYFWVPTVNFHRWKGEGSHEHGPALTPTSMGFPSGPEAITARQLGRSIYLVRGTQHLSARLNCCNCIAWCMHTQHKTWDVTSWSTSRHSVLRKAVRLSHTSLPSDTAYNADHHCLTAYCHWLLPGNAQMLSPD